MVLQPIDATMVGTRETFCIFDYKRCLESVFLKHSSEMFARYFLDFVARIRTQFVRPGLGQRKPPSLPRCAPEMYFVYQVTFMS